MKELTVQASVDNIGRVTEFVDGELAKLGCPIKSQMQIDIAIDELFGNIALYAYYPGTGSATVRMEVTEEPMVVILAFIDHGLPYNPLEKEDPDTTLSIEERKIGGLGVHIVKQMMDGMFYEYKDGQNVLTIQKEL